MPPAVPPWLPNLISLFRVILVPVWVVFAELANRTIEAGGDAARDRVLTAAVLATAGLSDIVDGWLARRFDLQSKLGAMLDATADKLTQVVLFAYLAIRTGPAFPAVPVWFLALLVGRDALLLIGCLAIRRRKGSVDTEHRPHGKLASLLLFALLLAFSADAPAVVRTPLLAAAAVLVGTSTALYAVRGLRQWRDGR